MTSQRLGSIPFRVITSCVLVGGVAPLATAAETSEATPTGDGEPVADTSDFAWNLHVQAERALDERSAWTLGYRVLGVDYDRSNFEYDAVTHGFLTGIAVRF